MSDAATSARETERKYEFEGRVPLDEVGGSVAETTSTPPEEQHLSAVYFDTAELDLLRSGVTLRRREGGHDQGWHLKLPAGEDTREEVRLPLTTEDRHTVPAELRTLTRLHARGRELAEVALLETHRRRWQVRDGEGRELAELVDDEVTAHTMGAATTAVSWREVEVELAEHGRPDVLDRIERDLLAAGARRSRSSAKLGRVLEPAPRRRPKVKSGSAGAVLLDYLREQTDKLRSLDPEVRRDAEDAVHQMRVTARRLRSAMQAYRKVLDRAGTDDLVEELRWLGRELNAARDAEVIEEGLLEQVHALPEELVLGPVAAQVTRVMQRRRSEGQARALAALDGDRYLRLHDALDRLLAEPPLTKRARRPAAKELRKGVAKTWRRTEGHLATAVDIDPGPDRDHELHEGRKAAKRMRYAIELAEPALGKPAKRLRKQVKRVHTVLGDHQDAVVARPVIRDLAAQAHMDGGNGFTYGLLYGRQTLLADRAEREMLERWPGLRRSKAVRKLAR